MTGHTKTRTNHSKGSSIADQTPHKSEHQEDKAQDDPSSKRPGTPPLSSSTEEEKKDDSSEHPPEQPLSSLELHSAFFDRDGDGVIWPHDTFICFRQLHFNLLITVLGTFFIHFGLSYFTQRSWIPDPFFRINIPKIDNAIHGSDTTVYNRRGNYDGKRFNDMFNSFTSVPHTHMTFWEGVALVNRDRNPLDFFGAFAAVLEWLATWLMLGYNDPKGMKKEDLRGIYDGTVFYRVSGREIPKEKYKHKDF